MRLPYFLSLLTLVAGLVIQDVSQGESRKLVSRTNGLPPDLASEIPIARSELLKVSRSKVLTIFIGNTAAY
jgi:hypothetical protein